MQRFRDNIKPSYGHFRHNSKSMETYAAENLQSPAIEYQDL